MNTDKSLKPVIDNMASKLLVLYVVFACFSAETVLAQDVSPWFPEGSTDCHLMSYYDKPQRRTLHDASFSCDNER